MWSHWPRHGVADRPAAYDRDMATYGAAPDDGGLQGLFEVSPDRPVHTSAAAEAGFVLGLVALVASPFSMLHALSLGGAAAAALFGLVGVATTSRPNVAGRLLAPVGLALAFAVLALVGVRYLGVDTAFGDALVPTLRGWLETLNGVLPRP